MSLKDDCNRFKRSFSAASLEVLDSAPTTLGVVMKTPKATEGFGLWAKVGDVDLIPPLKARCKN